MELLETDSRARLLGENTQYRRLEAQHRQYEKQLEQITQRRPFTQQDWFEESVVKKRRLLVKDQMEKLARQTLLAPATSDRA